MSGFKNAKNLQKVALSNQGKKYHEDLRWETIKLFNSKVQVMGQYKSHLPISYDVWKKLYSIGLSFAIPINDSETNYWLTTLKILLQYNLVTNYLQNPLCVLLRYLIHVP